MAWPTSWRKLEASGYEFDSIVVSGGAARSALIRQIIADVCGKAVVSPETPEPVLLGSAMVGAVAAGAQTMASAMSSMSTIAPGAAAPAGGAIAAFHFTKAPGLRFCAGPSARLSNSLAWPSWPELVIFDCDGVLVDSELIALAVTRRRLDAAGLRMSDEETRKRFLGQRLISSREELNANSGRCCPRSFPTSFRVRFVRRSRAT